MPNGNLSQPEIVNAAAPEDGSNEAIYNQLIQNLPTWFGNNHPIEDVVLQAYVVTAKMIFDQLQYVSQQMRLQTATDDNLDLFSQDYFQNTLPRNVNESDDSYRNRIAATLLQEKATRPGMSKALFNLTGFYPKIFEPWNPLDTGGYGVYEKMGYSTAGSYGSVSYPYQCFIDVYVSAFDYMGNYSGYGVYYGGYSAYGAPATLWYGGNSLLKTSVSDNDIYQTINLTKCEGTICWVAIHRIISEA